MSCLLGILGKLYKKEKYAFQFAIPIMRKDQKNYNDWYVAAEIFWNDFKNKKVIKIFVGTNK